MKEISLKINCGNGDFVKLTGTRTEIMDFLTSLVGPKGTIKDVISVMTGAKAA